MRWGARTLDVDVVTVTGDDGEPVVSADPELTLPHPRAHERAFVLVPWLAVDAAAELPGHGPVADLVAALDRRRGRRRRPVGPGGVTPMTPVRRRDLVVLAAGLALAAWLLVRSWYGSLPSLDWWLPAPLAVLAVAEALAARTLRVRLADQRAARAGRAPRAGEAAARPVRLVEPLLVARLAVLAQASAYVGAVFAGIWAGVLAHVWPAAVDGVQAAGGDTVTAVIGVGCSLGLVAAALLAGVRLPRPPGRGAAARGSRGVATRLDRPGGLRDRALHRAAEGRVQRLRGEHAQEAVAVEHGHPAGLVLQHGGEGALQRRVHRHPGVHPAGRGPHGPGTGRPPGGQPAVQALGVVEHDRPARTGPLHRAAGVGERRRRRARPAGARGRRRRCR